MGYCLEVGDYHESQVTWLKDGGARHKCLCPWNEGVLPCGAQKRHVESIPEPSLLPSFAFDLSLGTHGSTLSCRAKQLPQRGFLVHSSPSPVRHCTNPPLSLTAGRESLRHSRRSQYGSVKDGKGLYRRKQWESRLKSDENKPLLGLKDPKVSRCYSQCMHMCT